MPADTRLADGMTYRDRFIRTVHFEPVDRLPFRLAYGLMPGVLEEWHAQGLPRTVQTYDDLCNHFAFPTHPRALPLNQGCVPPFPEKVLSEDDEAVVATDSFGRTTKMLKKYTSLPMALDFPVRDRETWLAYKERLAVRPERIGVDLEKAAAANQAEGQPNVFGAMGFFWLPRDLMGDEQLCIAYYEQPDLVEDILETWYALIESLLLGALRSIRIDALSLGEDMAYRGGSLISRAVFDRFMAPYYQRLQRIVERHGIPVFAMDSDGCLNELNDWFLDCGVNMVVPNEVQAGCRITEYRRKYGRRLAYSGGLDKRVLTQGRRAIDAMLNEIIPPMMETGGGWVVSLDHRVVPGTPLADFRYFTDRVREMTLF